MSDQSNQQSEDGHFNNPPAQKTADREDSTASPTERRHKKIVKKSKERSATLKDVPVGGRQVEEGGEGHLSDGMDNGDQKLINRIRDTSKGVAAAKDKKSREKLTKENQSNNMKQRHEEERLRKAAMKAGQQEILPPQVERSFAELAQTEQPAIQTAQTEQPVDQTMEIEEQDGQAMQLEQPGNQTIQAEQPVGQAAQTQQPVAQPFPIEQQVAGPAQTEQQDGQAMAIELKSLQFGSGHPFSQSCHIQPPSTQSYHLQPPATQPFHMEQPPTLPVPVEHTNTNPFGSIQENIRSIPPSHKSVLSGAPPSESPGFQSNQLVGENRRDINNNFEDSISRERWRQMFPEWSNSR